MWLGCGPQGAPQSLVVHVWAACLVPVDFMFLSVVTPGGIACRAVLQIAVLLLFRLQGLLFPFCLLSVVKVNAVQQWYYSMLHTVQETVRTG